MSEGSFEESPLKGRKVSVTAAVFWGGIPDVCGGGGVAKSQICSCSAFSGNIKYCMQTRPFQQLGEGLPLLSQGFKAIHSRKERGTACLSTCLSLFSYQPQPCQGLTVSQGVRRLYLSLLSSLMTRVFSSLLSLLERSSKTTRSHIFKSH